LPRESCSLKLKARIPLPESGWHDGWSLRRHFGIAALAFLAACTTQTSGDPNPALCKAVLDHGGSASDYGRCMLSQGEGKSVGGVPVLNKSARLFLRKQTDDGCRVAGQTSTDYLACEFALDPGAPSSTGHEIDSLPLTILDRN